jgi:hypothetical protein
LKHEIVTLIPLLFVKSGSTSITLFGLSCLYDGDAIPSFLICMKSSVAKAVFNEVTVYGSAAEPPTAS